MNKLMCVVKDLKGGYLTPMVYENKAQVYRNAEVMFRKSSDTMIGMYPADYEMWCIAEWNPISGEITPLFEKEFMFSFADFANKDEVKNG